MDFASTKDKVKDQLIDRADETLQAQFGVGVGKRDPLGVAIDWSNMYVGYPENLYVPSGQLRLITIGGQLSSVPQANVRRLIRFCLFD